MKTVVGIVITSVFCIALVLGGWEIQKAMHNQMHKIMETEK